MELIVVILTVVRYVVIADVILSWVQRDPGEFPRSLTTQLTAPLYAPIRKLLNAQPGGFDFAPLIVWIGVTILQRTLAGH